MITLKTEKVTITCDTREELAVIRDILGPLFGLVSFAVQPAGPVFNYAPKDLPVGPAPSAKSY